METVISIVKPTMFLNNSTKDNGTISFDLGFDANRLFPLIDETTCQARIVKKDSIDPFWLPEGFYIIPVEVTRITEPVEDPEGGWYYSYQFLTEKTDIFEINELKLKIKFDPGVGVLHSDRRTQFSVGELFDLIIKR